MVNCRTACELAMPFIEGRLSVEDEEKFLNHVRKCEVCMEELEACNILNMVLSNGEDENNNINFDYKNKLDGSISLADRRIFGWKLWKNFKYIVTALAFWSVLLGLALQIYYWILVGFIK